MSVSEPSDCPAPDFGIWAVQPALTCVWSSIQRWLTKMFSLLKMDQDSGRCSPVENNFLHPSAGFARIG
jgi:hypothetical protein